MGCGGWFQGMVTWGGQNMATIPGCQLWSWHIPRVWAATVMTPPHRAFVWPVLQLLWIPEPIEWEGFTSLRDHHNKQTGPKTSSHRTNVQTTANGDSLLGFDLTQRGFSWSTCKSPDFIFHSQVQGWEPSILKINKNRCLKAGIMCYCIPTSSHMCNEY